MHLVFPPRRDLCLCARMSDISIHLGTTSSRRETQPGKKLLTNSPTSWSRADASVSSMNFIAACVRGADALYLGKVAIANIFVAILMRQDYVINAFFTVACWTPRS